MHLNKLPNHFFFLLLLCTGHITAQAQSNTICGSVSIHNSKLNTGKRQYVENATVKDLFGRAQQTLTGTGGDFKLIYAKFKELETYQFTVRKEGWEVINSTDMKAVVGQRDTVRISMALPGEIDKFRNDFYQTGKSESEKYLEKQLKTKTQELIALQKDKQKNENRINQLTTELQNLTRQRNNIDEQVGEIVSTYALVNLDDESPYISRSIELFKKGLLDSALLVLKTSTRSVEELKQDRAEIRNEKKSLIAREYQNVKEIADAGEALQIRANIYKTRFQIDSVTYCYRQLVYLDSLDPDYLKAYALHLSWLNQFDSAIYYSQSALNLYAAAGKGLHLKDEEISTVYNNIGVACLGKSDFVKAESALKKSLSMRQELFKQDSIGWQSLLAETYNNLGALYRQTNRLAEAENAYNRALAIYTRVYNAGKAGNDVFVASVKINLGNLYNEIKNFNKSETILLHSLSIWNRLQQASPGLYDSYMAKVFHLMGNTLLGKNDFEKAEINYKKALDINKDLAEKNPVVYRSELAKSQLGMGIFYQRKNSYDKAEAAITQALAAYKALEADNPGTYRKSIAEAQLRRGIVYRFKRAFRQAEDDLNEAHRLYQKLNEEQLGSYMLQLGAVDQSLGELYSDLGLIDKAETSYLAAQASYSRLLKETDITGKVKLAGIKIQLADLYDQKGSPEKSLLMYQQALSTYRQLAVVDRPTYEPEVANTLISLGDSYNRRRDTANAYKVLSEAIRIYRALYQKDPMVYGENLGIAYINNGDLFRIKKWYKAAVAAYDTALSVYKEMEAADSGNSYRQQIASTLDSLASLHLQMNDYHTAAATLKASLQMKLTSTNSGADSVEIVNTAVYLLSVLDRGAEQHTSQAQADTSLQVQIMQTEDTLRQLSTHIAGLQQALAVYYSSRARALLFASRLAEAEQAANKALQTDPEAMPAKAILAHAILLQNRYNEAYNLYAAIKPLKEDGKSVAALCIAQLTELKQKKIANENIDRIIGFLKQ